MTQGFLSPKAKQLYKSLGFKPDPPRFVTVTEIFTHSAPVAERESLQVGNIVSWERMSIPYRGRIVCKPWHPDGEQSLLAVEVKMHAVVIEGHWRLSWAPSVEEAISLIEQDMEKIVRFHLDEGLKNQLALKKKLALLVHRQ
jgi:hypothetical protein